MHVLVCGGGVIGASVAYFLTCRGVKATVIESTGLLAFPLAARRPLLCDPAIGWPMGRFGPLGRGPLKDVVFQDQWGEP